MTSKLKSIFKRQVSQPVRNDVENTEESSAIMKNAPAEFIRQRRDDNSSSLDVRENGKNEKSIALRRKNGTKRHNTSLGAIEDLLQCPICKDRLKSPRMMPCQHTFCEKCLEKQLNQPSDNNALSCPLCDLRVTDRTPDLLPTNLYIESLLRVMENPGDGWIRLASKNPVVSFAPLPERIVDSEIIRAAPRSPGSPNLCIKCAIDCSKENKCGHCKQIFCPNCWTIHTNELKEQLENFLLQMETISTRFEKKIEEFRSKVDNFKDSIEKDIESRIAELMQEREERMKKLSCQLNRGEEAAKEIQRRINEAADDLKEQTDALSETLLDNNAKVKIFTSLYREATEVMQLESSWNPQLGEPEVVDNSNVIHVDPTSLRDDVDRFYRRKIFSSKFIVNRELVQRPSGMTHDPWRDHVFVACPGIRQIVVLDRKYKLYKRYQSKEMMAPQGVAYVENTEELFVTDKWKNCIFVFNRKGEITRQMCKKGQAKTQLSSPEGLTYFPRDNILFVADTGNDRIQILELDGTYRGIIGPSEKRANGVAKSGKVTGIVVNHLNQPTDVSVTDDRVIVADCGNHKVKIFNHDGVLVHTLGVPGTIRRHFRSPEVVEVDTKGNILVGDSGNGRVQIFSPQGELLRVLGGRNSKSNKFGWISGLLVKSNFDIIVADNKSNAIKIF